MTSESVGGMTEQVVYMCPLGCGCLWRNNHDGTMSLFGPNSKSCPKCEVLPLTGLVPLVFLRSRRPQSPQVQPHTCQELRTNDLVPYSDGPCDRCAKEEKWLREMAAKEDGADVHMGIHQQRPDCRKWSYQPEVAEAPPEAGEKPRCPNCNSTELIKQMDPDWLRCHQCNAMVPTSPPAPATATQLKAWFDERETTAIDEIATKMGISREKVLQLALQCYQLVHAGIHKLKELNPTPMTSAPAGTAREFRERHTKTSTLVSAYRGRHRVRAKERFGGSNEHDCES